MLCWWWLRLANQEGTNSSKFWSFPRKTLWNGVSCSYPLRTGGGSWVALPTSLLAPQLLRMHCLDSPNLISTHRWSGFSQFTRKSSRSRWSLFKGTIIAVNSGQFVLFDINGGSSCVAWIMNLLGTHLVRHPKRAWRVRHNETNIPFVALVINLMVGVGATHSCSTWTRYSRFPLKYDWNKSSVKHA